MPEWADERLALLSYRATIASAHDEDRGEKAFERVPEQQIALTSTRIVFNQAVVPSIKMAICTAHGNCSQSSQRTDNAYGDDPRPQDWTCFASTQRCYCSRWSGFPEAPKLSSVPTSKHVISLVLSPTLVPSRSPFVSPRSLSNSSELTKP